MPTQARNMDPEWQCHPPSRYKMVQNETVIDSGLIAEKRRGFAGIGEMSQLDGSEGELYRFREFYAGGWVDFWRYRSGVRSGWGPEYPAG